MITAQKRFEVLKRDGFRCQYCWKCSQDVTLEIDHIVPRANWGSDDFSNLITACRECNMGKWKTDLNEWDSKFNVKVKDLYEHIKKEFYRDWNIWLETMEEEFNQKLDGTISRKTMWLLATFLQWWVDERTKNPEKVREKIKDKIEILEMHERNKNHFYEHLKRIRPTITQIKESPSLLEQKVEEFYEWWEFFDELTREYVWDFLAGDCYTDDVFIDTDWSTKNLNERLNYTITARINELGNVPKWIRGKYSLFPNAEREC